MKTLHIMISGRPGSGKSLVANMIARQLNEIGVECHVNDDDASPLPENYIKAQEVLSEMKSRVMVHIDCIRVLERQPQLPTPNS